MGGKCPGREASRQFARRQDRAPPGLLPFPFFPASGTEGRAGRGLRESAVCGIKVIFARVAELVDALDLESSGLSIRVQVPSLAPEFARTSPAWLWDVFVLRAVVQEAFLVRRRGRQRSSIPPRQRAGSSPSWPCCCMFLPRPACGELPRGIVRPSLLAVASRAIPHQTAALFLHLFLPVPERLLLPFSPFRQRTAFHLDRHASVLIFDGRELPGDRRPAA